MKALIIIYLLSIYYYVAPEEALVSFFSYYKTALLYVNGMNS